mgnify:CR=1 FL=1
MASEIKVDTIVNAGGDNDSGIDLATNDNIKFDIAGSQKAMIDSSGNVLVGKTSATTATVGAELRANGKVVGTISGGNHTFNRTDSDGHIINYCKDNSGVGRIGTKSGRIYLVNSSTGGVTFATSGGTITRHAPVDEDGDFEDNIHDIGTSSVRYDDIYATNGTIDTSDQNEKQDIASLTAKELKVANKLSALFKTFRWKDKVTEKGDKARTHSGIIAQEVQSAFSAEGLDASNYGLFISQTWWEKDKEIYDTKEEAPKDATEKTRLGVRYNELFSFIFSSIEARLTALESK